METDPALAIKPPLYVVLISGVAANGKPVYGTGFVVSAEGHVVTCRHVVCPDADGAQLAQLRVKLPYPAERPYAYELVAQSADDIAVLQSTVPLDFPVQQPMLHDDWRHDIHDGAPITAWGYSAREHYTQAQRFNGTVSGLSGQHGRIGLSIDLNAGDSGGPVLDAQRRVIGIAQAKDASRGGQAMAIPISLLRPLLRQLDIGPPAAAEARGDVVFQAPLPPADYSLVGRDGLLEELRNQLSGGRHVALCFKPGVGKSALAIALANDRQLRSRFDSGVLWASLNLMPNVLSELKKWGVGLGLRAEQIEALNNPPAEAQTGQGDSQQAAIERWAQALSRQIGERKMLLVIDDAWDLEPAKALLLGAPNCAQLVTTREQGKVAGMLGGGFEVRVVDELTADDGVEFLRQLAPNAVAMFPDRAREVFLAVGGLPQGLLLLGMQLRQASWSGHRRRIGDAFHEILSELKKHIKPLHGAIKVSYDALPDAASRRALQALSIFRPKPDVFTEEAALAVLRQPAALIDKLHDAGMVETMNVGDDPHDRPYTMHRTIAEFAREHLPAKQATTLHHRAAEHFSKWLEDYETSEHLPGSYGYQYRYENAPWQDAMDNFLYHLARAGDPALAMQAFGRIYFSAFWWWGCFAEFPFCTRLLQQAASKQLTAEARAALDLLAAFDAAYPKESAANRNGDWRAVESALTRLRALGGLEGALDLEADAGIRHTRCLTDIFVAEAYRFGSKDLANAERLYRDALALLPAVDWSRPWVHYHLGDMFFEAGRYADAARECAQALALAEAPALNLKERDNEIIANACRLRAALAARSASPVRTASADDDLLLGCQRAVLHAYAFQAIPEPPDNYTVAFYKQIGARIAGLLMVLHRAEPERALACCAALREFWSSYRVLAQVADATLSHAELQALLGAASPDGLCAYLFPAAPPTEVMHVAGSRYFNEAIMIFNEKLGDA